MFSSTLRSAQRAGQAGRAQTADAGDGRGGGGGGLGLAGNKAGERYSPTALHAHAPAQRRCWDAQNCRVACPRTHIFIGVLRCTAARDPAAHATLCLQR